MVRPIYHFHPEQNWMNDPNGPVFIGGKLHMFYQHNPKAAVWGNMTWGHAVSMDMVCWEHLPPALYPDMPYDKDGVYSGCCVLHEGKPHILYTGTQPETLCLAVGDEKGEQFTKYDKNPLIPSPEGRTGWRDPFVWKEADGYRLIIGSGVKGKGGHADIYRSQNLIDWEPLGEMASFGEEAGNMWECPNFFKDKSGDAALMVSSLPQGEVLLMRGQYSDNRMAVSRPARYDLGDCYYAPNTVVHPDGRVIQFGWMRERGDGDAHAARGFQGDLTLPRELTLERGCVKSRPAQEVGKLRGECLADRRDFALHAGDNALKDISGQHLEIILGFEPGPNALVLEMLRRGQSACARLTYDGSDDSINLDTTSFHGGTPRVVGGTVERRGMVELRIFVDGTALEVFINNAETLTTRAYPPDGDCDGLRLCTGGGGLRVKRLKVYRMLPDFE